MERDSNMFGARREFGHLRKLEACLIVLIYQGWRNYVLPTFHVLEGFGVSGTLWSVPFLHKHEALDVF
jgi:hypothetical protein